ncbi:uncharacterized protein LOC142234105 [Haematobia irritans]|uniref:uncharacterized protein LOC142234105 n=1 Tax=Haematobia irritans TaxID=7368 RepID=UPI003F4FC8ED
MACETIVPFCGHKSIQGLAHFHFSTIGRIYRSSMASAMYRILVAAQLLTSFSRLSALEVPLEFLTEGISIPKSMENTRHMGFPSQADVSVEIPPIEEDDSTTKTTGNEEIDYSQSQEDSNPRIDVPKWTDPHLVHHHNHHYTEHDHHHNPIFLQPKHPEHFHTHKPPSTLRHCSIEISSKIPGICQAMGSIGIACVSGDYIDVFNAECL